MKRVFAGLGVAAFLLSIPVTASADTDAMVLGVRSIEGDDDFALSLTGALRHAASQVRGWRVSDREVSLAQMSLAHGCDEPDAACMQQIAETLGMQRVIYGTVRRTSAGDNYDYAITLYMFNAESGQIEGSLTDTVPRVRSEIDFLRERVDGYITRLSGGEEGGTLRVVGNVPGAEIFVDGERVGAADAEGGFVTEVAAGRRRVEVRSEGYSSFRGSVTVAPGSEAEIEVTLTEGGGGGGGGGTTPDEGGSFNWAGWGLVGVGALAAGATIYSWLRLASLNNGNDIDRNQCDSIRMDDPTSFAAFRCAVPAPEEPNGYDDVCDAVDKGEYGHSPAFDTARDVCGEANALEVLQYVFLGVALAAGGAGAFLLATDSGEEEPSTLSLTPSVSPEGGRLDATLRF